MEGLEIPDGKYTIYIRRCATEADAANLKYTNSGVLNKNMILQVTDGKVKLLRYNDVINYNREIMAIGDGDNDRDMLRFAGIGVAMGNAAEDVKAAADYVTDSVDEDGIVQALAHFGLL